MVENRTNSLGFLSAKLAWVHAITLSPHSLFISSARACMGLVMTHAVDGFNAEEVNDCASLSCRMPH